MDFMCNIYVLGSLEFYFYCKSLSVNWLFVETILALEVVELFRRTFTFTFRASDAFIESDLH